MVTDSQALTPSYAGGGGQCSATYCHGASFTVATQGTNTRPSWTDGTYLANAAGTKNSADCNKCHRSPGNVATHGTYTIGTDCSGCHGHNGSGPTHIDGIGDYPTGCDSCHSYDTTGGGTTWGKGASSGLTGTTSAWGAHATHIEHLKLRSGASLSATNPNEYGSAAFNAVCGICHSQNKTVDHGPDSTPTSTTRKINFNGSNADLFGTLSTTPTFSTVSRSCSSLDCHFKATPAW